MRGFSRRRHGRLSRRRLHGCDVPLNGDHLRAHAGAQPSDLDIVGVGNSFEQILAYASQDETIHAGEFFGSGTVGNCCGLETGRLLEHGDVIELEIEKIGVLKNKVVRQDA